LPSVNKHVRKGLYSVLLWDRVTCTIEADFRFVSQLKEKLSQFPSMLEERNYTSELECLREEDIVAEDNTCVHNNVSDLCLKEGAEDQFRGKYGTGGSRMHIWRERNEMKIRQAIRGHLLTLSL
jgi:hypothetical protein